MAGYSSSPAYFPVTHPVHEGVYLIPDGKQTNVESALRYKARPNDLFICSYPKCGTTWLQNIVWRILHEGQPCNGDMPKSIPYLEFDGEEAVHKATKGEDICVIKTHFPYHWIPKHKDAKYIYIAREPKDVCSSLYHHVKGLPFFKFNGSFDDIYDRFLEGTANCWDYFDMLMNWYAVKNNPNILFILYENLLTDTENEIVKISKFIGRDCDKVMEANDRKILHKIVEETSIIKMRHEESKWIGFERVTPHMRKGIIGDWKNNMTFEQGAKIDNKLKKSANGNGCEKLWEKWS